MSWIIKGVLISAGAVILSALWCCLVLGSEDDDREGRG